jgi:hypothetical protein
MHVTSKFKNFRVLLPKTNNFCTCTYPLSLMTSKTESVRFGGREGRELYINDEAKAE